MTTALTSEVYPTDKKTGLTLPLSKFLGSQDLAKHQAMVALEMEVLARKVDRFGWDRDRGTLAHDRVMRDWIAALQDYPLSEVKSACREWVRKCPGKMPNEGHILAEIQKARAAAWEKIKARMPSPEPEREPRVTAEAAREILAAANLGGRFPSQRNET